MNRYERDDKALDIAREIMRLVYGPIPIGGSVQLLAQVQLLVTKAMLSVAAELDKGEGQ